MILSQKNIEEIAAAVTKDFNVFYFGCDSEESRRMARGTPIDQFAREYLGMAVSFARLSSDGSICGLTAYADTEYITEEMGVKRAIPLRKNQILLDVSFIQPGQVHKLCGKRRFTLAHECAHQILFQMESDAVRSACTKILMPQKEIDLAMWYFAAGRKFINYEGVFAYRDKVSLMMLCKQLAVSKSAAVIRLRQLGYIEDRPYREYIDPLEVWP